MAENLRAVISRLKDQNSQASKPAPIPAPVKEVPQEIEGLDDEEVEETKEVSKEEEKVAVMPSNQAEPSKEMTDEQRILMEIEMLQNDGRYRAELLHQIAEVKQALVVIAGVLVDLAGHGKKTG